MTHHVLSIRGVCFEQAMIHELFLNIFRADMGDLIYVACYIRIYFHGLQALCLYIYFTLVHYTWSTGV